MSHLGNTLLLLLLLKDPMRSVGRPSELANGIQWWKLRCRSLAIVAAFNSLLFVRLHMQNAYSWGQLHDTLRLGKLITSS